jgi:hypothetical protein
MGAELAICPVRCAYFVRALVVVAVDSPLVGRLSECGAESAVVGSRLDFLLLSGDVVGGCVPELRADFVEMWSYECRIRGR